jgi:hypothetical protein
MKYAKIALLAVMMAAITSNQANAELTHQFKNPAFSGVGYSSHVLTIESIEKSRRDSIDSQRRSEQQALINAANNTPLSRFMNLFQSQVYAQLSTQLSNNLFKDACAAADGGRIPGCEQATTGVFSLDNNTITWQKTTSAIKLTVVDSAGTITTIDVPIANFAF